MFFGRSKLDRIASQQVTILAALQTLIHGQITMADAQADLVTAITDLRSAIAAHMTDVKAQVDAATAAYQASDDKAFEDAANQIKDITSKVNAVVTQAPASPPVPVNNPPAVAAAAAPLVPPPQPDPAVSVSTPAAALDEPVAQPSGQPAGAKVDGDSPTAPAESTDPASPFSPSHDHPEPASGF